MKTLDYRDVPGSWAICFQNDCPLCGHCLRHTAALLAPADLTHHATVLPAARKDGECCLFVSAEPVSIARGMKNLLTGFTPELAMQLRHELYDIFGSCPQFYRYRAGRFPVTPEQQKQVAALFLRHGITTEPHYDQTTIEYYFPSEQK